MLGFLCSSSAAAPATCGVAADVPKKSGKLALSEHWPDPNAPSTKPRKVLLTPSGPTMSGFWRVTGVASAVPVASNRIGSPPLAEKGSSCAGDTPHRGVLYQ